MPKGKAKFNSGVVPSQPRLLRSRKRECPSDDISPTVDRQATVDQTDTEGNNTEVVITPLQGHDSPPQECATITAWALEQSCLTKHDDSTEEQHAEKTEQENYRNINSQLQDCIITPANDTNKEEIHLQKVTRLVSRTYTDQHQVLMSEDGDGSCAAAFEEQLGPQKNAHCNLERNHESTQEEPGHMCVVDLKEITKESTLGLPVRKKQRMGTYGLTERERSLFLLTQKCNNRHNGVETVEKQLCNNTADLVDQEENVSSAHLLSSPLSIPVDTVTEQGKAEVKLQSSHCGGDNRAETEVTTLDGTSTLLYPVCSEGKTSETEGRTVPDPEQADELISNQPAEEKVEKPLGNLKQQEHEERTSEIPVKQRKEVDDSAGVDCDPVVTFYTNSSWNKETEKMENGSEAAPLHVCEPRTRDQMMGDTGAEAGASSTDSWSGKLSCVEIYGTAITPSNSERKDNWASDGEIAAGSSTMNPGRTTGDTVEPFGSQYLDYVSDSQLNSIAEIEEERMEREEDPGFSCCPKDATNLICGLIWELSSLNRKVMATHKELENLRRSCKTSRSFIR